MKKDSDMLSDQDLAEIDAQLDSIGISVKDARKLISEVRGSRNRISGLESAVSGALRAIGSDPTNPFKPERILKTALGRKLIDTNEKHGDEPQGKTVYILTAGDYSDYQICSVFDDEGLANQYAEQFDATIERWPLNECAMNMRAGLLYWDVCIKSNGDVDRCVKNRPFTDKPVEARVMNRMHGLDPCLVVFCWARDRNHAIKIAAEKRQEMVAAGVFNADNHGGRDVD